ERLPLDLVPLGMLESGRTRVGLARHPWHLGCDWSNRSGDSKATPPPAKEKFTASVRTKLRLKDEIAATIWAAYRHGIARRLSCTPAPIAHALPHRGEVDCGTALRRAVPGCRVRLPGARSASLGASAQTARHTARDQTADSPGPRPVCSSP